jgi:hypothetical protein
MKAKTSQSFRNMDLKKIFGLFGKKEKSPKLSEKEIFGSPDFRIGDYRVVVSEPTAERYVAALKVLGSYSFPSVVGVESIEQYAVRVLEKAHEEEMLLESKLKELVMQKSEEFLDLYKAVFVLDGLSVTLEDVLKEPLWQIKLGVMVFFWRHKNHFRGEAV